MLESSSLLDWYYRECGRNRRLEFTTVQMMTTILLMKIKKLTFANLEQMCDGRETREFSLTWVRRCETGGAFPRLTGGPWILGTMTIPISGMS